MIVMFAVNFQLLGTSILHRRGGYAPGSRPREANAFGTIKERIVGIRMFEIASELKVFGTQKSFIRRSIISTSCMQYGERSEECSKETRTTIRHKTSLIYCFCYFALRNLKITFAKTLRIVQRYLYFIDR